MKLDKLYKIYFLAFNLLIFSSLHALAQLSKIFKINDFSEKVELKGEKLRMSDEMLNPAITLFADSLLIIRNNETSPAFDIISPKTGKIITRFGKRGRGPGEMVGPWEFQYLKQTNEIMVQDIQGKKLMLFCIDKILENNPVIHNRIVPIDTDILAARIKPVDGGNFFCNLIGHKDGYMNALIDANGKLIRFLNKYPKVDFQYNPLIANNVFGVVLDVSPDLKTLISAFQDSDIIDIYNSEGKHQLQLIGPNYRKLHVIQGNNGASLTSRNNYAFKTPSLGKSSFMIPYVGRPRRLSDPGSHTNQIFWIGLNGDLLKHFEVSPPVSQIAIDWEKRIIYGLNVEMEPSIYLYKY